MKIVSRPEEENAVVVGGGPILLQVTDTQLELIAALVSNCRLGQGTYSSAAYELLDMIEEEFGTDYVHDSADRVDLQVTVEDGGGGVVFSTKSGTFYTTLEV